MQATEAKFEKEALQALRTQIPVRDLPGVRIRAVKAQPEDAFDVQFELESGKSRISCSGSSNLSCHPSSSRTSLHGSGE